MPETLAVLLLAVWVGAIAILVNAERTDKFLWILVLFAVAGVFSSILPLAITPEIAVVANGATLILFIVLLEILNPIHRLTFARIRHRARRRMRRYEARQNIYPSEFSSKMRDVIPFSHVNPAAPAMHRAMAACKCTTTRYVRPGCGCSTQY